MTTSLEMKFLLDEGVPNSVGIKLQSLGYSVTFLRDVLPTGSPDQVVCTAAMESGAILVAIDKDMRRLAGEIGVGKGRFSRLSLLRMNCQEPQAVSRLEKFISLIEHEWEQGNANPRRLFIEIKDSLASTHR